MSHFLIMI